MEYLGVRHRGRLHGHSLRHQRVLTALVTPASDLFRSIKLSDIFTLTGRVGYAYEQWLAYFKGGWATADVSASYTQVSTGTVLSTVQRPAERLDGRRRRRLRHPSQSVSRRRIQLLVDPDRPHPPG
jgi:hypothetical protein